MESLPPTSPQVNLPLNAAKVSAILSAIGLKIRTLPPCRQREELRALLLEIEALAYRFLSSERSKEKAA